VLYVGDRRAVDNIAALRREGFRVLTGFSLDHAVALTVAHKVDCVVLEEAMLMEVGAWSAAQSFKLADPRTCVLLILTGKRFGRDLPKGVDSIVTTQSSKAVVTAIGKLMRPKAAKAAG